MPRQDTVDFLTAFAVGTVLGIGATLLLQPQRTPQERVLRKLKPYRKQMRKGYRQVARGVRGSTAATADFTGEVVDSGRELLGEFRSEVAEILGEARKELQEMMQDQFKDVGKGVKRARRKFGV